MELQEHRPLTCSLLTHQKTSEQPSGITCFVVLTTVSETWHVAASIAGCLQRMSQRNLGHTPGSRLQDLDGLGSTPMTTFHAAGMIVHAATASSGTTGAVAAAARFPATVAAGVRHR